MSPPMKFFVRLAATMAVAGAAKNTGNLHR
jgi:hypothetical protein